MDSLTTAYRAMQAAHINLELAARAVFPVGKEVRWEMKGQDMVGVVIKHVPGYRVMIKNLYTDRTHTISAWRLELDGRKIEDLFK